MTPSKLFHLISTLKTMFFVRICTILVRLNYALYPNLHLGKKARFYGMPKFKNKPGGKITIGKNCAFRSKATSNLIGINRPCIISTNTPQAEVIIGNNCGFSGTVIGAFARIEVKDNVRCGANTLITDSDWHTDDPRTGTNKPVLIEENVWLGEGVKVLKGVTIGENSVIGAGSVVTKSISKNVFAGGNPCNVIREIIIQ